MLPWFSARLLEKKKKKKTEISFLQSVPALMKVS
jgi:hypothetical protein